jgi:predicted O-linked N-acetylglucosamine transferase (SPINDLY family)
VTDHDQTLRTAQARHQAGSLVEAEQAYRRVLDADPGNAQATHFLGLLACQTGNPTEGMNLLRRSIELAGEVAEFHSNLAAVLAQLGRPQDALVPLREAVRLRPDFLDAHHNLGTALEELGRLEEAAGAYAKSASLASGPAGEASVQAAQRYNDLGRVHHKLGRLGEAEAAQRRAIELDPNCATAHASLALLHDDFGRIDDALACHQRVVQLRPDLPAPHSQLLFTLLHHPAYGPEALFDEHRLWAHRHARPLYPQNPAYDNEPSPDRTLRIGYLSPDFRDHTVPRFFEPVLRNHDRRHFTPVLYADVRRPDAVTARLRESSAEWRNIAGWSDERVAAQVREDRIDILVELTGHMLGSRLSCFALRPAPVQATYIGYPHSTALGTIDYRITDAVSDPPGMTERFHTEQLVRLPGCAWCYQPDESGPDVNDLPAMTTGCVTFGSLNRLLKISPAVIRLWARVLDAVPTSRLLLLAHSPETVPVVRRRFEQNGVRADRLDIVTNRPRAEYLRLFHRVDIALDPFPYNGMTTTCDALWMGVPTVSLVGRTHVSRVGLDLLTQVGLQDLAPDSPDSYVAMTASLAHDLARLHGLRAGLRQSMRSSPLLDGAGCAARLEHAYRAMWASWCETITRK